MSNTSGFVVLLDEWNTSVTNQAVTGLADGDYYFHVRAVDDHNDTSSWSNTESISVAIPNQPPSVPILNNPGTLDDDGDVTLSWSPSFDSDGTIAHYQLQISFSNIFATILDSQNFTSLTIQVTGLTDGIYFFRVRAIDNDGTPSPWSNTETIEIQIPVPTPTLPPIPGFPIEALILGIALCLGISLFYRSRKRRQVLPVSPKA
jgi:predicted phage tail protein